MRIGAPATTAKPSNSVALSPAVVMVAGRRPGTAFADTVTFAVALVALWTVSEFTVTSGPKVATVTPAAK